MCLSTITLVVVKVWLKEVVRNIYFLLLSISWCRGRPPPLLKVGTGNILNYLRSCRCAGLKVTLEFLNEQHEAKIQEVSSLPYHDAIILLLHALAS